MKPNSIHQFRTHQYRVFLAEPYLKLDLQEEIRWHEEHISKLEIQSRNPKLFHSSRTSHDIDEHRERHFREHVLDSIPFHRKILSDHKKRLKTILELIPEKQYKKLRSITIKLDTVPDYFVFDRISKKFFFVVERPTPEKEKWSRLVQRKKIAEVMFLE
jgi:hypothetical protein